MDFQLVSDPSEVARSNEKSQASKLHDFEWMDQHWLSSASLQAQNCDLAEELSV